MVFSDLTEGALLDLFDEYGPFIEADTAISSRVLISLVGEAIFLQTEGIAAPGGELQITDLRGCGGVVHVIDRVLLPTTRSGGVIELGPLDEDFSVASIFEPPLPAPDPQERFNLPQSASAVLAYILHLLVLLAALHYQPV